MILSDIKGVNPKSKAPVAYWDMGRPKLQECERGLMPSSFIIIILSGLWLCDVTMV